MTSKEYNKGWNDAIEKSEHRRRKIATIAFVLTLLLFLIVALLKTFGILE